MHVQLIMSCHVLTFSSALWACRLIRVHIVVLARNFYDTMMCDYNV